MKKKIQIVSVSCWNVNQLPYFMHFPGITLPKKGSSSCPKLNVIYCYQFWIVVIWKNLHPIYTHKYMFVSLYSRCEWVWWFGHDLLDDWCDVSLSMPLLVLVTATQIQYTQLHETCSLCYESMTMWKPSTQAWASHLWQWRCLQWVA